MPSLKNHRNSKKLLQTIYADDCDQFDELLTPYALAKMQGGGTGVEFAKLAEHLEDCADCAETYRELVALLSVENTEKWEIPNEIPQFPIAKDEMTAPAYLQEQEPNRSLDLNGIKVWLKRQEESVARLLISLIDIKPTQLALRSQDIQQSIEEELYIDLSSASPSHPLEVRIMISSEAVAAQRCSLHIEVNLPERWPDFSGTDVILHMPGEQVQRVTTGSNGLALFQNLDQTIIPQSQLEIIPHP